jgi:beta-phosphoglucomutase-like phosphatase (HAD superfamily)
MVVNMSNRAYIFDFDGTLVDSLNKLQFLLEIMKEEPCP